MANITISADTVSITSYVTYYSITTTSGIILYLTRPVTGSGTAPVPSFNIGIGIKFDITYPIVSNLIPKEIDYITALSALGFIVTPKLADNTRSFGSSVDKNQIVDLRREEPQKTAALLSNYNNNIDVSSSDKKKEINSLILSKAGNSQSAINILRTLSNRFSNK